MDDLIYKSIYFFQEHSYLVFFLKRLTVTWHGDYYQIKVPREEFYATFPRFIKYLGDHPEFDISRDKVIGNALRQLRDGEHVVIRVDDDSSHALVVSARQIWRSNLVDVFGPILEGNTTLSWRKFEAQHGKLFCPIYVMTLIQPRTKKGRADILRIARLARSFGLIEYRKEKAEEYLAMHDQFRYYQLSQTDDLKSWFLLCNCGSDKWLAGKLADVILREVYHSTGPVTVTYGGGKK